MPSRARRTASSGVGGGLRRRKRLIRPTIVEWQYSAEQHPTAESAFAQRHGVNQHSTSRRGHRIDGPQLVVDARERRDARPLASGGAARSLKASISSNVSSASKRSVAKP